MSYKLFGLYPKPKRFPIVQKLPKKPYLTNEETKLLLSKKVIIEEKMDGKPALIIGENYILFCEDLKQKHSIHYHIPARFAIFDILDKKRNYLVDLNTKIEIYKEIKFMGYYQKTPFLLYPNNKKIYPDSLFLIPILESGFFKMEELPNLIGYSHYAKDPKVYMEGIVVKTYFSSFLSESNRAGKIVRQEFSNQISIHYRRKKAEYNIIDPNKKEYNNYLIRY
ncbi:MAG: RNA ligase family protein [Candidatus Anstonellaceae archaeon]